MLNLESSLLGEILGREEMCEGRKATDTPAKERRARANMSQVGGMIGHYHRLRAPHVTYHVSRIEDHS